MEEHRTPAVSCQVASQCPALDDTFPFLPPGWLAEWTDDGLVMRPPQLEADQFQAENVV